MQFKRLNRNARLIRAKYAIYLMWTHRRFFQNVQSTDPFARMSITNSNIFHLQSIVDMFLLKKISPYDFYKIKLHVFVHTRRISIGIIDEKIYIETLNRKKKTNHHLLIRSISKQVRLKG